MSEPHPLDDRIKQAREAQRKINNDYSAAAATTRALFGECYQTNQLRETLLERAKAPGAGNTAILNYEEIDKSYKKLWRAAMQAEDKEEVLKRDLERAERKVEELEDRMLKSTWTDDWTSKREKAEREAWGANWDAFKSAQQKAQQSNRAWGSHYRQPPPSPTGATDGWEWDAKISQSEPYVDTYSTQFATWRRAVEAAFEDYATITEFPTPPAVATCNKPACYNQERALAVCVCDLQAAFSRVPDLKTERLRWHPDKFAKVSDESKRVEFQAMAGEVFVVVDQMYRAKGM